MSKRVLFLDVDGVLNSVTYYEAHEDRLSPMLEEAEYVGDMEHPGCMIDPDAVARLNRIVNVVSPEIVLHSNWRKSFRLERFNELLEDRGFEGQVDQLAEVPDDPGYDNRTAEGRTREVVDLIRSIKPDEGVVLDDLDLTLNQHDLPGRVNFVWINSQVGLTDEKAGEVIAKFDE